MRSRRTRSRYCRHPARLRRCCRPRQSPQRTPSALADCHSMPSTMTIAATSALLVLRRPAVLCGFIRIASRSATRPQGGTGAGRLTPDAPIAPGTHDLRVDQLTARGEVAARVGMPFQREQLAARAVAEGSVEKSRHERQLGLCGELDGASRRQLPGQVPADADAVTLNSGVSATDYVVTFNVTSASLDSQQLSSMRLSRGRGSGGKCWKATGSG